MKLELLTKIANEFKIIILKYSLIIKDNFALKLLGGKNTINNVDNFVYDNDYIYFCNSKEISLIFEKSKIIKLIYPLVLDEDIFIIMLYIYYILNLIDVYNLPFNSIKHLFLTDNEKEIIEIIRNITVYDIIYQDINISSNIRQAFLLENNIPIYLI